MDGYTIAGTLVALAITMLVLIGLVLLAYKVRVNCLGVACLVIGVGIFSGCAMQLAVTLGR
jgi:hypothetical protein